MTNHEAELIYTYDDDGIWIYCDCEWLFCLGFSPSPAFAYSVWEAHCRTEKNKKDNG